MNKIVLLFVFALPITLLAQQSKSFVGFENGDVIYANQVTYRSPWFGKDYILLNDEERYDLSEVDFYQNRKGYYKKLSTDNGSTAAFFKRIVTGPRIEAFTRTGGGSYSPSAFIGTGVGLSFPMVNTRRYDFYSKDRKGVITMSYGNLKDDLADHPFSMATLQQVKTLRIITGVVYVAAAGLLIAGLSETNQSSTDNTSGGSISPMLIAGAVAFTIPIFLHAAKRNKMIEALEIYNR